MTGQDLGREEDGPDPFSELGQRAGWSTYPAASAGFGFEAPSSRNAVRIDRTPPNERTTDAVPAAGEVRGAGGKEGHAGATLAPKPFAWIIAELNAIGVSKTGADLPGRTAGAIAATDMAGDAVDDEVGTETFDAGGAGAGVEVSIEALGVLSAGDRSFTLLSKAIMR